MNTVPQPLPAWIRRLSVPSAIWLPTLFALALLVPTQARTEEAGLLSEDVFLADIPRVFSASRLPQSASDSPGAVTVIDRDMIRASGARELAELFRLVPGFVVGHANGGRPVVAYHGLSGQYSQRMQVLLDGRSLYAPYLFGGIDWNTLPVSLDDIERIEVLRGSNSASYGANAFLGMVNITTRAGAQSRGVYASTTLGADQIRDTAVRIGAGDDRLHWRLSAGSRADTGLSQVFDSRRTQYLSALTEWQMGAIDDLQLSVGATRTRAGLGRSGSAGDPERYENTDSSFWLTRWRRTFAPDHEASFSASQTTDRGKDRYGIPVTPTDSLTIDYGREAVRSHLEYQHFLALSPTLRASWGAEWRSDRLVAPQLFNTGEQQRASGTRAYLNTEWRSSPRFTFNLGGLVEHDSLSGTHFAPRLVVNFNPDANQTLRLGYSEAFRTPSLFEQRSDWRFVFNGETVDIRYLSRGGLKPERVRAFEASYLGNVRQLGLSLDARLFHERISDLIVQKRYALPPGQEPAFDSGAYDLRNTGSAQLTGMEYQLRWRPDPRQTWILGHYLARREANEPYLVASIPAWSLHLMGILRFNDSLSGSVFWGSSGAIRWIGESRAAPRQQRLDLRLEQRFRLGTTRGSVALVGQHLNGAQTEFRSGQLAPRRGWVMLSLEY